MRLAVIRNEDNVVDNLILGDETTPAPLDHYLIEITEDLWANIGFIWDGTQFIDPNPPVEEEPSTEETPTE